MPQATTAQRPSTDIDLYSEEIILEPYEAYRELREQGPAVWMDRHDAWVVSRYDTARSVLGDPYTFSSAQGVALNDKRRSSGRTTLASDPPEHDLLRDIVAPGLTPRALRDRRDKIRAFAEGLVE